ncbi:DUF2202 domain-containing protein [Picosynechococcus sp. PCC 11901]|uniref:ferritin-like domain-containing protein n=1 Tax=Picosynechococcus sp. PCC 11901 TaxID=2579791 RepID=UPI0010FBDE17|nr:DUF2202 domain-containing protein [Picosynechococcus sp. PCC 11901]QCS50186.1 DUF2202 domain-containing protein [Picosynechococcus sp. PCC 11901]
MFKNLEIALNEALQDEYKACETYHVVIEKFGAVRPFINIIEAEKRHIRALLPLFRKYQLPIPINPWVNKIPAPATLHEACLAGVQAEIENGEMYKKLLALSEGYDDVQRVFRNLQRASQQNHLRTFQRAAGLPINTPPLDPEQATFYGQRGTGGRKGRGFRHGQRRRTLSGHCGTSCR